MSYTIPSIKLPHMFLTLMNLLFLSLILTRLLPNMDLYWADSSVPHLVVPAGDEDYLVNEMRFPSADDSKELSCLNELCNELNVINCELYETDMMVGSSASIERLYFLYSTKNINYIRSIYVGLFAYIITYILRGVQ